MREESVFRKQEKQVRLIWWGILIVGGICFLPVMRLFESLAAVMGGAYSQNVFGALYLVYSVLYVGILVMLPGRGRGHMHRMIQLMRETSQLEHKVPWNPCMEEFIDLLEGKGCQVLWHGSGAAAFYRDPAENPWEQDRYYTFEVLTKAHDDISQEAVKNGLQQYKWNKGRKGFGGFRADVRHVSLLWKEDLTQAELAQYKLGIFSPREVGPNYAPGSMLLCAYRPESGILYYTDGLRQFADTKAFPWEVPVRWIEEIFDLQNSPPANMSQAVDGV